MCYKKEFGTDFQLGFKLSEHLYLIDKSYRNDDCPSFYFIHNNQFYILWVDHLEIDNRENENSFRYTIQIAKNEGDATSPEVYINGGDILFESEEVKYTHFYEAV